MSAADTSTDLDPGPQGDRGPWLRWHAEPTRDGLHAGGTWSVRGVRSSGAVDLTQGLVLDWPGSQTGWMQTSGTPGVPPQKLWNASRARFAPRPPGAGWNRALRIAVAWPPGNYAVWEQGSAGAWLGFVGIMGLLKEQAAQELPRLPVLAFTGHRTVRFDSERETLVPEFRLLGFIVRPACLSMNGMET